MRYKLSISTLLISTLLFTNNVYAKGRGKNNGDGQPSFGIKVGGSLNRISVVDKKFEKINLFQRQTIESGNILFVTAGLFGEYPIHEQFAIGAELSYERKGLYDAGFIKMQGETINLPISIKYYPENTGEGISLQAGIQPSFVFSKKYFKFTGERKEEQKEEALTAEEITNFEKHFKIKSFDLAVISGIEYTFPTGLKIGFRMSRGILELLEEEKKEGNEDNRGPKETRNSAGNQAYVGYNLAKLL
jgi:hypothetical protein